MHRHLRTVCALILLAAPGCSDEVPLGEVSDAGGGGDGAGPRGPHDECGNGMDDDGDRRIDEDCFCGAGETQPCFSGDYPSREVGSCMDGVQRCEVEGSVEWGRWGACEGDVTPRDEACDGQDDDCDGAVDEGCPCTAGETHACGVEFVVAPCTGGTQRCRDNGTWSGCEGAVGPSAERCDGEDNDCDGERDEGCGCIPEPEVCGNGDDDDCDGDVDEPACTGCVPSDEICNANDDDCDGTIDEAACSCDSPAPVEPGRMRCEALFTGENVYTTPIVIDLDGDTLPEIVFSVYNGVRSFPRAVRGRDCSLFWVSSVDVSPDNQIAAGDIDGDGRPELVFWSDAGRVVVLDETGMLQATSAPIAGHAPTPPASGENGGPVLADLDGAAPAEIVIHGAVLRMEGGMLRTVWEHTGTEGGTWGLLSIAADVDLDGAPEVITGNRIYEGTTGADETPAALRALPGGYAAVAQLDASTPEPEIVLVSSQPGGGQLNVVHPRSGSVLFGPYSWPAAPSYPGSGGTPTVVDVDCDGVPEIGVALANEYRVYDLECAAIPMPAGCAGPGVRWSLPTRTSIGTNAASAFDLNGDGVNELVYQDDDVLRVLSGPTGGVAFSTPVRAVGELSLPSIADLDGDGHAEIIAFTWGAGPGGVRVFAGMTAGWAPARRIWNQQPYHVTHVNEDGTIPIPERRSWEHHNGYRQQTAR